MTNKKLITPGNTSGNIQNKILSKDRKQLRAFSKMLFVTLPLLFPGIPRKELERHQGYILHILTHKGTEYTVRYLKATFESLEHMLLRLPGVLEHDKVSLGKDVDGWPNWLGIRLKRKCLLQHRPSIRYAFTLCSARRLLTVKTLTNLSSITSPPKWSEELDISPVLTELSGESSFLFKGVRSPQIGEMEEGSDRIQTYTVPKLQISLKSSPNGVSFFSFPWDRAAVIQHNLVDKLKAFASVYFTGDTDSWLDDHLEPYEELTEDERTLNVGKISLTYETGKLKPRVFAIVDSVTQSLLGDFHRDLMNILRGIPEDCTFDHDKVVGRALEAASEDEPFYGFADLSNATDAIPIYLYERIGNFLRPGLGTAWVGLFDRQFSLGQSVEAAWDPKSEKPKSVKYQTGQPMGALSSWPFMALVHHVIVWTAFGSRKRSRGRYLILGDDIVIFDRVAYERYLQILDTLCVLYTHNVSTVGFEFAKRTFYKGAEVTGAYTQALWACLNQPELFALEWKNLASRGYKIGLTLPGEFRTLLKVSRKRFLAMQRLMLVPHGSNVTPENIAHFCAQIQGRNYCLLGNQGQRYRRMGLTQTEVEQALAQEREGKLVEGLNAFRQAASFLIKQRFQSELTAAKAAVDENKVEYLKQLRLYGGLVGQYDDVMQAAYQEVIGEQVVRIRYLERDLKRLYLQPTDEMLLRPNLLEVPRRIDFSKRDGHQEKLRMRAKHQFDLMVLLSG